MRHMVIAVLASMLFAVPALASDYYEEADTPAGNPAPPEQGFPSWNPPDAAVVLYDNGPLITCPGCCAAGANESLLQTSATLPPTACPPHTGLNIFGYGHARSTNFRVADNFTVPAGECWAVDAITFFAYQTNAPLPPNPSTINHVNFQIWNGPPNAGGAVIYGNMTTNTLQSSAYSSLRTSVASPACATSRPIMADRCLPPSALVLNAGTYWIDWQTGGSLTSGPWAPPVSILGLCGKPGANALQRSNTLVWTALLDGLPLPATVPQDLPFIIEGTQCATSVEPSTWGAIKSIYE